MLLAAPDIDANLQAQDGACALTQAAAWGHEEIVQLLLTAQDINANLQTEDGDCALSVAVQNGHTESKRDTSGIKGVHYDKRFKRWYARICINGKLTFIGFFTYYIFQLITF